MIGALHRLLLQEREARQVEAERTTFLAKTIEVMKREIISLRARQEKDIAAKSTHAECKNEAQGTPAKRHKSLEDGTEKRAKRRPKFIDMLGPEHGATLQSFTGALLLLARLRNPPANWADANSNGRPLLARLIGMELYQTCVNNVELNAYITSRTTKEGPKYMRECLCRDICDPTRTSFSWVSSIPSGAACQVKLFGFYECARRTRLILKQNDVTLDCFGITFNLFCLCISTYALLRQCCTSRSQRDDYFVPPLHGPQSSRECDLQCTCRTLSVSAIDTARARLRLKLTKYVPVH